MNKISKISCLMPRSYGWGGHVRMFAEAWEKSGGETIYPIRLPHYVHTLLSRSLSFPIRKCNKVLILPAGWRIDSCAWPYCWKYEIVPMMWDLWPPMVPYFKKFIQRNKTKLVFCTQRRTVEKLSKECPGVEFVWIPEGIDVSLYSKGLPLHKRSVDLFSYGRKNSILADLESIQCNKLLSSSGFSFKKLTDTLQNSKITLCVPRCDTCPEQAMGVETLTQRYWECMLSGTLIVGMAPQELIDICGYNPVIKIGLDSCATVQSVLRNLTSYQELANRNYQTAMNIAGWDKRMPAIKKALKKIYSDE